LKQIVNSQAIFVKRSQTKAIFIVLGVMMVLLFYVAHVK